MERTWRLPYGSVETFSQNGWGTREFLDDRFGMLTKAIELSKTTLPGFALEPLVHCHLGVNDLKYNRSAKEVAGALKLIALRCLANESGFIAHLPIYVQPGAPGWPADSAERLIEYHVEIIRTGIRIGDTQGYCYFKSNAEQTDGVHPTRRGSVVWGSLVARSMRSML